MGVTKPNIGGSSKIFILLPVERTKSNGYQLIRKLIIKNNNFASYLLDESHVSFIFGIGAVFVLHLNSDNWATPGVLHIN